MGDHKRHAGYIHCFIQSVGELSANVNVVLIRLQ